MADDKSGKPDDAEERGVVSDVIGPILGGGANAVVSHMLNRPKDPPPPPPPSIELPPGVDKD